MIKHIVWWTLKPEAEGRDAAENALRIKDMGEALNGKIPGLLSLEISQRVKDGSTVSAELVLQSTHNTQEALQGYAVHPLHLELAAVIKACTEKRQCLDYEI